MDRVIEIAWSWEGLDYLGLGVSENAPAACALYQRLGFAAWGVEPDSIDIDGVRYDEIFMALRRSK